jgi:poly(3-hydroxybutyrate) depolymerase
MNSLSFNQRLRNPLSCWLAFSLACIPVQGIYGQLVTSNNPPGLIYVQNPRSQVVVSNTAATLSVTASGSAPFTYQWFQDGRELPGATNRSLSFAKTQPSQEGLYQVIARNDYGAITSQVAALTVIPPATNMLARIFTNQSNAKLPYRIFSPLSPAPEARYPLVLFLHGIGERGTDNLLQVRANPHFMAFVSYRAQTNAPVFLVAPQCPTSRTWQDTTMVPQLGELLDALIKEHPIDTNKIIITGLSMGGYGSWSLLDYRPDFFAAALPICGGGNTARCDRFRHVPIWNFHAVDDGSVPISESRNMINALRIAGGQPIYTEYRSGGHGIWDEAYATPGLRDWTLAQDRESRPITDPQLIIRAPTTNSVWITGAGRLDMAGTAVWDRELISQVIWTNLAQRTGGLAAGTSSWTVQGASMISGRTNSLIVIASTISFAPASSGSTTFSDTILMRPAPPIMLRIYKQNDQAIVSWTGGKGPFRLQTATSCQPQEWTDLPVDNMDLWSGPMRDPAAFFRVQGN